MLTFSCSLISFVYSGFFVKACDKLNVSGSGKWKFGGKTICKLEIRVLKWW